MEIQFLGNKEILKLHKTAFLAASTIPPEMVLKCYLKDDDLVYYNMVIEGADG